jgi:hypothetical protein
MILQAGMSMPPGKVDFARRDLEVAVDEMHQAVSQVTGKKRTIVAGPVFQNPARDIHSRVSFVGQPYIGEGFVVAQENVEAGLVLLY